MSAARVDATSSSVRAHRLNRSVRHRSRKRRCRRCATSWRRIAWRWRTAFCWTIWPGGCKPRSRSSPPRHTVSRNSPSSSTMRRTSWWCAWSRMKRRGLSCTWAPNSIRRLSRSGRRNRTSKKRRTRSSRSWKASLRCWSRILRLLSPNQCAGHASPRRRAIRPIGRAVVAVERARNVHQSITDPCSRGPLRRPEYRTPGSASAGIHGCRGSRNSRNTRNGRVFLVFRRNIAEGHYRQEHRQDFTVAEIIFGEAFRQDREDHGDCSVQDEAGFRIDELSPESHCEVPQDFHDHPEKDGKRWQTALRGVLQVDIVQVAVIADR